MAQIKVFNIDIKNLSKNEQEVIEILKKVGIEIHKIWEMQVDPIDGKILLYPEDCTVAELREAAQKDKSLLSSYTVVKRDDDGGLFAVDYTEYYKKHLDEVIMLLEKASKVSDDKDLKAYLERIAKDFKSGDFDDALLAYLQNSQTKIEILLGPIETYIDKLMGVKKASQFSLRVLSSDEMEETTKMVDIISRRAILRPSMSTAQKIGMNDVKLRIDNVLMLSGRQAGIRPSSTNLPNEEAWVKKYGVKIIVYLNSLNEKFTERLYPLVDKFLLEEHKSITQMQSANYRLIVLHEISEGIVKFEGMEERLAGNYNAIRELNADLFGVKSAKYHVLDGLISHTEYEDLLLAFLIFAIDTCNGYDNDPSLDEYVRGFAVVFNYLFNSKALEIVDGRFKIDFPQLAIDIDILSNFVVKILESGSFEQSKKLFDEFGSFEVLKKLK